MQIIQRKEAKLAGLNKYFTGKPCVNDHIAERYVQSGACYDCILATKITKNSHNNDEVKTIKMQTVLARKEALEPLVDVKFRVYQQQIKKFAEIAWAFTVLRNHLITLADVYKGRAGTNLAGGTMLYTLTVHPDDVEALRAVSNDFLSARNHPSFNVTQAAAKLAQQAAALQPGEDTTPPIRFT